MSCFPDHISSSGTSAASGMLSVGTRADAGETTNVGHPQNQTQANGTGSADSGPSHVLSMRNVAVAVPAHSSA